MQEIIFNLDNIFLIILIVTFGIYSIFFLIKAGKSSESSRRTFFLGAFGFMFGWTLMNLIFLFGYSYPDTHIMFTKLWKVATIIGMSALVSLLFVIEKHAVQKSRFFFSIITLIGIILVTILPVSGTEISGARLVSYVFIPIGSASIIFLYLYLVIKLEGRPRKDIALVFIGVILIFFGYVLDTELMSHLIPPALVILDSILMMCGGLFVTLIYYRRG